MRYAIFGDVHGNLEALRAVLKEIDAIAPDGVFCLGDIIGYGADPIACIDLLRARGIPSVAGNHDRAVCGKFSSACFNDEALRSLAWTRGSLDRGRLEYIAGLPLTLSAPGMSLAHGTLAEPEKFGYVLDYGDAARCLEAHAAPYAFVAHTHVPVVFIMNGEGLTFSTEPVVRVPAAARAVVNVGSVGQPRDRDTRACFCLFDAEQRAVEIRRVAYDVEASVRSIRNARLPEGNAARLRTGS